MRHLRPLPVVGGVSSLLGVLLLASSLSGCNAGTPPRPTRATSAVAAEAEFPWPAPRPSAYYKLPRTLLAPAVTLGEVSDRLEEALGWAGYTENKFYRVKMDGFCIVTRIESIRPDGSPRPVDERWSVDSPPRFSLDDLIQALLRASRGLYRVWAFVVTRSSAAFEAPPTEQDLERVIARGDIGLSQRARSLPFTQDHDCFALVYEFERRDAPPVPELRLPSSHTGQQHLFASNILRGLQK